MAGSGRNRDEFTTKIKRALALRVNYRCSFDGCDRLTSGPSEEGEDKFHSLGDASHICAASPEGPRYDANMSPDERSSIGNGIWLCTLHNRLVDGDTTTYTATVLRRMKHDQERRVSTELANPVSRASSADLIAVGTDIVFVGELEGQSGPEWRIRVDHFQIGDISTLISFIERFDSVDSYDRYVLVGALGDGRELAGAPQWEKAGAKYVIKCPVRASALRTDARGLPADMALNDTHDIFVENGEVAKVSGLDALPQKISMNLSVQRGEMWFHPSFGVRLKEFFQLFHGSVWLSHLIKLEVIRIACIPYPDSSTNPDNTPLLCVRRVIKVEEMPSRRNGNWQDFDFELELEGLGNWSGNVPVFLPLTSSD